MENVLSAQFEKIMNPQICFRNGENTDLQSVDFIGSF